MNYIHLFISSLLIPTIVSFNLSPVPNTVINKQQIYTNNKITPLKSQLRSSFFGFSINLQKSQILIGAPRAQPVFYGHKDINEPGAIFKCNFNPNVSVGACNNYIFDEMENINLKSTSTFNSEVRDNHMLGFSMAGGWSETDQFITCAPHLKSPIYYNFELSVYLLNGICYWVPNTISSQPSFSQKIISLRNVNYQEFKFAESGFSAHMTEDNSEIIIGCPGILNWQGSVIKYQTNEAFTDIPSPYSINITSDSYFGYSVGSANFLSTNKTFYIASAPRSSDTGEIYIFDVMNHEFIIYRKLSGFQYGEYFGYAVLCEDFNKDGLPDIAVSAPFYTKDGFNDHGAVYVFINKGNFIFTKQVVLKTDFAQSGQFGTSISKIGDINFDGFNDLLVSAPFEDDGAVYVYLGGPKGVSSVPSQRIQAPKVYPIMYKDSYKKPMFGFSLSRGVDLDGNGYNDVAIGAPNSEVVFIYRSYPVIDVISSLTLSKNEVNIDDSHIYVKFCARYESKSTAKLDTKIKTLLTLDPFFNRASINQGGIKNKANGFLILKKEENCLNFKVYVRLEIAEILNPILIMINFDTYNKIPENDTKFCNTCVVINPESPKMLKREIKFFTGCKNENCVHDLFVSGTIDDDKQPFILGSKKSMFVKYTIMNVGEPAYMTQLIVKMCTNSTQYSRIPSSCSIDLNDKTTMTCDIKNKMPIRNQEIAKLNFAIDVAGLVGSSLKIIAEVTSIGYEQQTNNNKIVSEISLVAFSNVEIVGKSSSSELHLDNELDQKNLIYEYKIFNNGPSQIKKLLIALQIPLTYIQQSSYKGPLLNIDNTKVTALFDNKALDVNWIANEEPLNRIKKTPPAHKMKLSDSYDNVSKHEEVIDQNLLTIPKNRTISVGKHQLSFIDVEFVVEDFKPDHEPVIISLNISLELRQFEKIFTNIKNIFVYKTAIKLSIIDEESTSRSMNVTIKNPYTIIYGRTILEVPMHIYILSGIIGMMVFILMIWGLKNCGFFEREKMEELKKLKRESVCISTLQQVVRDQQF